MNGGRAYAMMIASLVIVGTIGVFRRFIPLSSAMIATFRGLIGAASLYAFVRLRKKGRWPRLSRGQWAGLVASGACIGINWLLLFDAFEHTTIAKATLCYYLQPTLVLLSSPLAFGERLTGKKLICAAVALMGMVLVSGVLEAGGGSTNDLRGVLLALGAAGFYTLVVILNKKVTGVDPFQKTVIQLLCAALVLVPGLVVRGEFAGFALTPATAALLLTVGVIHTGLAYAMYFGSMNGLKAQTISTLGYIDPIVAMLTSAVFLGERLSLMGMLGAVMILGSALVSERA